jgi:hypothetical protein
MNMEIKILKRNLLAYWMFAHGELSPELQNEFLNHPIVHQIVQFDIRFARYAMERKKFMLLKDILECVLEIEAERIGSLLEMQAA